MLSASAFNAFLKTLEEPPRHAIFILARAEGVSGAGGLSRGADTQKERLALRLSAEMTAKQTDEGQEAPI